MRIIVTIDDIMVEIDDETSQPTVEAIETILDRAATTAVQIYEATFEAESGITFTPAPGFGLDEEADEDDA